MVDQPINSRNQLLAPQERISEVLFGLIMALTITNSLGIAHNGDPPLRTLLAGALGCNLAWGTIDGVMYLMAQFAERGRAVLILQGLHKASDPSEARRIVAEGLPPILASVMRQDDLDLLHQRLLRLPAPSAKPQLTRDDWWAAVGIFLLAFLSTLPIVIPFTFVGDPRLALRVSNGIAIGMLFLSGYALGRHSGNRPWKVGLSMVAVGVALVGLAMALGG